MIILLSLISLPGMVFATCMATIPQTVSSPLGDMVVQRDLPVGTIISTFPTSGTGVYTAGCSGGGYPPDTFGLIMSYSSTLSSSGDHIYDTPVPGVGIRMYNGGAGAAWTFDNPKFIGDAYGPPDWTWYGATVQIIKTGPIRSGILPAGTLAKVTVMEYDNEFHDGVIVNTTGGTVTVVACSINTPLLTFPIGDIPVSRFGSAAGTIPAGTENTQNLGLNCDADANINVELTGTQNPDLGNDSVLALTGQGDSDVATGVGVQLLYNGTPLQLNNRIVMKQSAGGQETLPLTARYYQTRSSVTTGKANATATLNLTYQ
ncbi:fimbrial protein [Enterobacter bugandensis]